MNGAINDGGPAFPVPTVFNPHSGEACHTGQYWDGNGMTLRDWLAGQPIVPNGHLEAVSNCDDADLLERYGTEEDKEQGFTPVFGVTNPAYRHAFAAVEVAGSAMPMQNILLRQRLEARARAEIRYEEADAMLAERAKKREAENLTANA